MRENNVTDSPFNHKQTTSNLNQQKCSSNGIPEQKKHTTAEKREGREKGGASMKQKYMLIAVDQDGHEISLKNYKGREAKEELILEGKDCATTMYEQLKEELHPNSVKMLSL
jgi:hypothetical protein